MLMAWTCWMPGSTAMYGAVCMALALALSLALAMWIDHRFGGYIIGRNCLQFLTVDRSHFRIIYYASVTTRYNSSV